MISDTDRNIEWVLLVIGVFGFLQPRVVFGIVAVVSAYSLINHWPFMPK